MNRFYLSFGFVGIATYVIWGYLITSIDPNLVTDSFAHRLIVVLPFIFLLIYHIFIKKINIEVVTYSGVFWITADYCYLIAINENLVHATGLYVVLTASLSIINNRWFLWLYSISLTSFCSYSIFLSETDLQKAHWINMLTLIALTMFFGLWRIKNLEQLANEHKRNIEKSQQLEKLNNIAAQAAHDIRSPVMALETFISSFSDLESKKVKFLKNTATRINEIADYLVSEYQKQFTKEISNKNSMKNNKNFQTVSEIVESLREEKILLKSKHGNYKILIHGFINYQISDSNLQFELKRILSNVINNSIEAFTKPHGLIDLILNEDHNSFTVEIKDNADGIPSEIIDKVFERGSTYKKSGGSGLGLAHAKETIENFGGKIYLSSKQSVGTLVQITIPKF